MTPAIERAAGVSLITPGRLENLRSAVLRARECTGDLAELGVYQGGSAGVIAEACPWKKLWLFDTFTGLPHDEEAARDPGALLRSGMYRSWQVHVKSYMRGARCQIVPGLFPESARYLSKRCFCFVHIDCDLYSSARDAIAWFWPRLSSGGILFFDDYGCDFTGVTDAVDEAFSASQIERQVEAGNGIAIGCLVQKEMA